MVELKKVDKIKFGILSPHEIEKMSVVRIDKVDTYDEKGLPIDSGFMDSHLGTTIPAWVCKTCGNQPRECSGHFGHIKLARPLIHVGFAPIIQKILQIICRKCSRLMIMEKELENLKEINEYKDVFGILFSNKVSDRIKKGLKTKICPYCGEVQLEIIFEKPTTFYEKTESRFSRLNPIDIRKRFERIIDEDYRFIGIDPRNSRAEWMILTVLPVPPLCMRPSEPLESGKWAEDDLTHKLVDILRVNQRLQENIEASD